ncbi:MAG: threonylcarbamoyl-AMP synthase, partial [Thermodesulfobacteria bacterium]|nr:threonylcarbamoyl-AMP synthase [Thermodesulfobacteriota bacterium]
MAKIISLAENQEEALRAALKALKEGKVVVIPTETFYGLAVDCQNEEALKRLFALKRRPEEKPVLLLVGDLAQLEEVVREITPLARKLIAAFWPGPLTLVLEARPGLSSFLTAGTGKVAVRLSSHPVPRRLALSFGRPITGTSANLSGKPPARSVAEVLAQLPGVDLVLDAGVLPARAPSTIVDASGEAPVLLREGEIPWAEILGATGDTDLPPPQRGVLPARGEGSRRRR